LAKTIASITSIFELNDRLLGAFSDRWLALENAADLTAAMIAGAPRNLRAPLD
jgi:hypothetical protein